MIEDCGGVDLISLEAFQFCTELRIQNFRPIVLHCKHFQFLSF